MNLVGGALRTMTCSTTPLRDDGVEGTVLERQVKQIGDEHSRAVR